MNRFQIRNQHLPRLLVGLMIGGSIAYPAVANEWVRGQVKSVEDYGGNSGGVYEVLIDLKNKVWWEGENSQGLQNCTERFRLKVGLEGIDDNSKNRIFSMMVAAYSSGSTVRLYVDSENGPFCNVEIGGIGEWP